MGSPGNNRIKKNTTTLTIRITKIDCIKRRRIYVVMDIFPIKASFKERTRSDDTKGKFSHLHNVWAYFNITYPLLLMLL